MCGICGMVSESEAINPQDLDTMMEAIKHRGPDDAGTHIDRRMGLGFRRLSIRDVQGGHQPMSSENQAIWSVMNGEIYNDQELRAELKTRGHQFHSGSDAEIIPHLYEEWGIDGIKRLRGMFGLAIWDKNNEAFYLVRDHFGIKPVYYAWDTETLLFASEIKSLLATGRVQAAVNLQSLGHYLTFQYVPVPQTMFEGIQQVPPAHYLEWKSGRIALHRYWSLEFQPQNHWKLEDLTDAIEATMRDSVQRHTVSDVPWGAYLSSGIDSSAVVAMAREMAEVDTFSIGFPGNHGEINELTAARETAQYLGTRHHEILITPQQYLEALPNILYHQEDPVADPSAPALYFLAEQARQFVTVVLSGEGADELFAGYPIYQEPAALGPMERMPLGVRERLGKWAERLPEGIKGRGYLMRGSVPLENRFVGNAKMFLDEEKLAFMAEAFHGDFLPYTDVTGPVYQSTIHLDPVTRMQTVDCYTWLPGDILMKADKMSMAHSLELRVPFLDVRVFELAASIPYQFKVNRDTTKIALRAAMRRVLPKEVAERPKLGFPIPIRHWLKNEMKDFVLDLFSSTPAPYFKRSYLMDLAQSKDWLSNRDRKTWTFMIFLLWHKIFIEQSLVPQRSKKVVIPK